MELKEHVEACGMSALSQVGELFLPQCGPNTCGGRVLLSRWECCTKWFPKTTCCIVLLKCMCDLFVTRALPAPINRETDSVLVWYVLSSCVCWCWRYTHIYIHKLNAHIQTHTHTYTVQWLVMILVVMTCLWPFQHHHHHQWSTAGTTTTAFTTFNSSPCPKLLFCC